MGERPGGVVTEIQDDNLRSAKEARETRDLAPWAMHSDASVGRRYPERPDALRTPFERDRDRIVHSTAFRRLMYKTQVFVNQDGDHNRTRLSHSLEVCQVARTIGNALRLNEPLCEVVALAHDIGHPPFGHRGEWALDELMKDHGGFRHNAQVLRVVDRLERRSPDYPGLNLTREVRESLLKHEKGEDWPEELAPRPARPLLEAQVVDLADSTAYNKHDVEDGLLAGMFDEHELEREVALWRRSRAAVAERYPGFLDRDDDPNLRVQRIANELMGACIEDIVGSSKERILAADVLDARTVQGAKATLVGHSEELARDVAELSQFLYRRFYRHEYLQRFLVYARQVLTGLFDAYRRRPDELAAWYQRWSEEVGLERAICDYLAGMTDRFAQQEYERLVDELPQS
ncbi:MAG: deoxyguanosinetriphosphate triphosphohydrolase [bacterium]|nr:deoxyguanosinetriphosphate triphosphohydrolase [bacterium]